MTAREEIAAASAAADGLPWDIQHVDLRAGVSPEAAGPAPVHVTWWWNALPLGHNAYFPSELPLADDQLRAMAARLVANQLAARLPAFGGTPHAVNDGRPFIQPPLQAVRGVVDAGALDALDALAVPAIAEAADLGVIVCTRDRPEALDRCLQALRAQRRPAGELLVVDNSASGSAREVAQRHDGVRYVHEPRPGLSVARNAGLRHATRPLLAFTDDDVRVSPSWTAELVEAFTRHPDASVVTGLVLPATLDTEAERFFQIEMGGFGVRHVPVRFDARFFRSTLAIGPQVWRIGAGANMAFRREVFERVGGFDERLGAGAAGCSEDSELWYRVLANGGVCVYEPRAVAFHHHRGDWPSLRGQMRAYLRGHVAALLIQHARFRHAGNLRRALWHLPSYFADVALRALVKGDRRRGAVLAEEVRGWAGGLAYALRPGAIRPRSY
jgi:GT2 family glycosyltransferase